MEMLPKIFWLYHWALKPNSDIIIIISSSISSSNNGNILVINFMQGIYNYIPETNHVSRVNSVAAVRYLQFVLHVMLFRPWSMFCTFTLACPQFVCSAQYGGY